MTKAILALTLGAAVAIGMMLPTPHTGGQVRSQSTIATLDLHR